MANPYLTLAAQIWAGLDGLQRRLEPGPATQTPYAERPPTSISLPTTLVQALDALSADTVLQQGLGPAMACVHDTVKRHEAARHAQAPDASVWVSREYFDRF